MLRIAHSGSMTIATLGLDGKLVGPWVDEVRTTVAALRKEHGVCLNLQHLSFADADGLRLLCALRCDGVELVGASPLIAGLLETHRDRAARESGSGKCS